MRKVLFACLVLAACASNRPEQQAFKRVMDSQIGKHTDDSDYYPLLYHLRQADSKTLPNGNVEEEYRAGRKGQCGLIFEIAAGARRVVAWRIHGPTGDCVIEPMRR